MKSLHQILGAFTKFIKLTFICQTFCPYGTTRFPVREYSWNLISEYFSKICRENSRFIKIGQEQRVLYTKLDIYFWSHLAQFFTEWEVLQTNVVGKIRTHFMFLQHLYEYRGIHEIMVKTIVEPDTPRTKIWRMCNAMRIPKATNTHSEYVILIVFPLQQW